MKTSDFFLRLEIMTQEMSWVPLCGKTNKLEQNPAMKFSFLEGCSYLFSISLTQLILIVIINTIPPALF